MRKTGLSIGKKILFSTGFVLAVLGFLTYQWWQTLNVIPVIAVPMPTMPSPNAFVSYLQACNAMTNAAQVDAALMSTLMSVPAKTPPVHKGVINGMMGGPPDMMGRNIPPVQGTVPGLPTVPTFTLAQTVALIRANASALKALRQGFAYEYRQPPLRSMYTPTPYHASFRAMARLLALIAVTKAKQGDWNGAINSHLDCIRFGQDLPRGGALMGMLVGDAVQAIGAKYISNTIDHLNARQARAAVRRMEEIIAHHVPFTDELQEEEWTDQAERQEMFHNPKWRDEIKDLSSGDEEENSFKKRAGLIRQSLRLNFVNKRVVLNNYTHYMDQVIANARQPYAAHLPDPPKPDDPVNEVMIVSFSDIRKREVEGESRNVQILLRLALRAYWAEHDRYPDKLSELIPAYLHQLPDDPTALQGTFGYQRSQATYLLFSNSSVNSNTTSGQAQPAP